MHEQRLTTVVRRLLLWTLVCCVSAAPSFAWAYQAYDRAAMALGVALFAGVYTALTSTEAFDRFHRRPFVRRTLYIGYGTRIGLSLAFPVGLGLDMMPGMLSLRFVEAVLRLDPHSFAGTFATTLVQGAILNAIVLFFMWVVYGIQRATMKPPEPPEDRRRGFEVLAAPQAPRA